MQIGIGISLTLAPILGGSVGSGLVDDHPLYAYGRPTFLADFVMAGGWYELSGSRAAGFSSLPSISIARASTGLAQTVAGTWTSFSSGQARITDKGLLVEGAATNVFLNSAAPATQTITFSSTGNQTLSVRGSGSVAVAAGTATITGAGTATNGSPVTFNVTAIGTCNFTVSGSPTYVQVESGTFATSPIVTTGSSATRLADVISLPFVLSTSAFTVFADCSDVQTAAGGAACNVRASANVDEVLTRNDTTRIRVASVSQYAYGTGATVNARNALAATTARVAQARNGSVVNTQSSAISLPTTTTLDMGSSSNGAFLTGYIRRLAIWSGSALSDANLQALTT